MRKIYTTIFLIFILGSQAFAQDWQCIHDSTTAFYKNSTNYLSTIRIDSVVQNAGYRYYYSFPCISLVNVDFNSSNGVYTYCYTPYGLSRIGTVMSAGESGNFFFNRHGDAIRFCTNRQLNDPWICCRISDSTHLDAFVSEQKIENILGVPDSVKIISFQAKRNTGENIFHVLNNQIFKISKSFGMIMLYDFNAFPGYDPQILPIRTLAGFNSHIVSLGEQTLTQSEIYNFSPGDIFESSFMMVHEIYELHPAETKTISTILNSTLNLTGDTISYKIARFIDDYSGWDDIGHGYFKDTVVVSYPLSSSLNTGLDNFPEESVVGLDSSGALNYATYSQQYRDQSGAYHSRRIKNSHWFGMSLVCGDSLVANYSGPDIISYNDNYIDGCGGPYFDRYWTDYYYMQLNECNKLVYYQKGAETWGTPFDTTNWHKPIAVPEINAAQKSFQVYPNPSNDQVTITIPGFSNGNYKMEIITLEGSVLDDKLITSDKSTFSIKSYSKGIYILKVFRDKKLVGQEKLVKH